MLGLHVSLAAFAPLAGACFVACSTAPDPTTFPGDRRAEDGAREIPVTLAGSLQNPCFSPDGSMLALTRFTSGYNDGVSVVELVRVSDGAHLASLSGAVAQAVNLPGSCWNAALDSIVYTTDAEGRGDEIWQSSRDGTTERVSDFADFVSWEPSWSPDGSAVVFERHDAGGGGPGSICTLTIATGAVRCVTDGSTDERQPNWSPRGDLILFQARSPRGDLDIFTVAPDGSDRRDVTDSPYDDTDASFSRDGSLIVFSSDRGDITIANLFVIPSAGGEPRQVTHASGWYDGAASFTPDGRFIAFESRHGEPDGSPGTTLRVIAYSP